MTLYACVYGVVCLLRRWIDALLAQQLLPKISAAGAFMQPRLSTSSRLLSASVLASVYAAHASTPNPTKTTAGSRVPLTRQCR